jgi:hypothetical protein
MSPNPRDALRAWFLGPRAENADLMERLITESFRDHVFWRRNFRPEDGITIREVDRRQEGYEDANATLTQELMALLADLKRDVPFFSGRYQGHMVCEPTIAAQVGYFAAMLYNPNNVTREAGPVTTRLELEVADQLARMIGFDPARTWGHLTSGGTVANFEALWIARSLFYLPVAAAMAARAGAPDVSVQRPDGTLASLASMGLYELLNLRGPAALDAWDALRAAVPRTEWPDIIDRHTLAHAGYQEYTRRLARLWGDPLPDSVVLVAATAHYSWEKIVRALGIGAEQLAFVPVDRYCRIDPDALWERIEQLHARRTPILACISVCGSTEEGRGRPTRPGARGARPCGGAAGRHLPPACRCLLRRLRCCGSPTGRRLTPHLRRDPCIDADQLAVGGLGPVDRVAGMVRLGDDRSPQAGVRAISRRRHAAP